MTYTDLNEFEVTGKLIKKTGTNLPENKKYECLISTIIH